MVKVYSFAICVWLACGLSKEHLTKRAAPAFQQGVIFGTVTSSHITEASGLVASRYHPGYLYTINDHGNNADIYIINGTNGRLEATLKITGARNDGWDDIAIGKCLPGIIMSLDCIHIVDADPAKWGLRANIYKFSEPYSIRDQEISLSTFDKVEFSWGFTNNWRDSGTLLVDPNSDVYIISKVDGGKGVVAKIPYSAWSWGLYDLTSSTALNIPTTHHKDPVGGDISPDGNEVLIKTVDAIFYWNAEGSRDYLSLFSTPGRIIPYVHEHQGEAVCWDVKGQGYYTLGKGNNMPLYYYVRTLMGPAVGR